ncbi:hypothetical protein OIU77_007632 [Salix suchowensis]|uniref:Uncharacterized protein n=1 Tax=Salix suchowensis TaxID=1278906 RepID=A0ABQ9AJ30_9ROSI|nr:hypothetical protein OIU77_007632 [Salix suchowensis]
MKPYDNRYSDPDSYHHRHRSSDLMGQKTPVMGSTYGRDGPVPYSGGGGGPPPTSSAGRGGPPPVGGVYPRFERPASGFSVGRGGGGGGGGGGGRGFSGGRESYFHGGDRRNDAGRGRGWNSGSGRGGGGGRGGRFGGGGPRRDLDTVALPKQDFGNLVPFEKSLYFEDPSIRAMSET